MVEPDARRSLEPATLPRRWQGHVRRAGEHIGKPTKSQGCFVAEHPLAVGPKPGHDEILVFPKREMRQPIDSSSCVLELALAKVVVEQGSGVTRVRCLGGCEVTRLGLCELVKRGPVWVSGHARMLSHIQHSCTGEARVNVQDNLTFVRLSVFKPFANSAARPFCLSSQGQRASMLPVGRSVGRTRLTATGVSTTLVDLSWQDNTNYETGFLVQRRPAGANAFVDLAPTTAPDATSFSDATVTAGVAYDYRVVALRSAGDLRSNVFTTVAPSEPMITTIAGTGVAPVGDRAGGCLQILGVVRVG